MTASEDTPLNGQERSGESDGSNERRWTYADGGEALAAPSTRQAAVTLAAATSTTERFHEGLSLVTEAGARAGEEYEPEVRLGIERDDIEETLSINVELDAAEARALARSLEEAAREAEEIVVDERVRAAEADR